MVSIFTKIVNGEIPCHKVAENENFLAFLDIFPCSVGHTLVIPKKEIDYIFDLENDTYLQLMQFAKEVAAAIEQTVTCKRISIAVVGLEVPHAHVHLIPLNSMADFNFNNKLKLSQQELADTATAIRQKLA
jgi:histidine triad (HIT) family protein